MKTNKAGRSRGAVLVVALIMLAMVTFLVVAFVGFSRFERASVQASLVRTQAEHALEIGLAAAQGEVMDWLAKGDNHGLLVSQNIDGSTNDMASFTNHAMLVTFAKGLKEKARVPVFVDRDGDEIHDTFPFMLDLNAALNPDGNRYQHTVMSNRIIGDPHWVGLLEYPDAPHNPTNKFVARYAYLTVPAHKALNIRYHHNALKRETTNLDKFGRLQGSHPRELNLAAALHGVDRTNFPYQYYNPYFKATDPAFSSAPNPLAINSAFGFAAALNQFGGRIEDAMHLARSSKNYNELLDQNPGNGTIYLRRLSHWLNNSNSAIGGGFLATPPYSFYQFMETVSAVPLPVEKSKFDVNSIRERTLGQYAVVDPTRGTVEFLQPHGLRVRDKVEPTPSLLLQIDDPIDFELEMQDAAGATSGEVLRALAVDSEVETRVPHRLITGEPVVIMPVGATAIMPLAQAGVDADGNFVYSPVQLVAVEDTGEYTLNLLSPVDIVGWGVRHPKTKRWIKGFDPDPRDAAGDLPAVFDNAGYALRYRHTPRMIDLMPYFVDVINPTTVRLHRSAALDDLSQVVFASGSRDGEYIYQTGTGHWKHRAGSGVIGPVRIVLPPGQSIGNGITRQDVFTAKPTGDGSNIELFTSDNVKVTLGEAATHRLQMVFYFQHDLLSAQFEKMAGLMLNESIETTGGATLDRGGNLTAGSPVQHQLGGFALEQTDAVNPGALHLGIGGHHEPKGPWHHPRQGIAWRRGTKATMLNNGHYTREMERIFQVSANIADLYSGHAPVNQPIAGTRQLIYTNAVSGLLPYGEFGRNLSVDTHIRQTPGRAGVVLCLRTDETDVLRKPAYQVWFENSGASGRLQLAVWRNGAAEIKARSAILPAVATNHLYRLKVDCETGQRVRVSFEYGGETFENAIDYQHSVPLMGKVALLAVPDNQPVVFTKMQPTVLPAELKGFDGWTFTSPAYSQTDDVLPTVWRGVFNRDENNYVHLSGFKRWRGRIAGLDRTPATPWYLREAPVIIGVKDRGLLPGRNLAPALTEFSLRTIYDRETKALYGRLTAEVRASGQSTINYGANLQAVIQEASYTLIYTDRNGIAREEPVTARTGIGFSGGSNITITSPTFANIVCRPGNALPVSLNPLKHFAGVPNPNDLWFAQLTEPEIEIVGRDKNANTLPGYTLTNIRIDSMKIWLEGELHLKGGDQRTVDYFRGALELGRREHFANVDPQVVARNTPGNGRLEWGWVPEWSPVAFYGNGGPQLVVRGNRYWRVKPDIAVAAGEQPPENNPKWMIDPMRWMRKLDLSWQVNDPLVNSVGSDFKQLSYVPGGYDLRLDNTTKKWLPMPNSPQQRRHWVPRSDPHSPLHFSKFTHAPSIQMGVNLARLNHASRHWRDGGDLAIKDPGVGRSVSPEWDWRFPDVSRGRIPNVGWLGQVHRGTPWQTLYMKSRFPGVIPITAFNHATGEVTAPNHNMKLGDFVKIIGKCPPEWTSRDINNPISVDANGNIQDGQIEGYAQPVSPNVFKLWPTDNPNDWNAGTDEMPSVAVANTVGMAAYNTAYWRNWAGSNDTLPANDRKLLEVFSVDPGMPVRGRFSVNNDRAAAWAAPLCGLSIPQRYTKVSGGTIAEQGRLMGANLADLASDRDRRIDAVDLRWRSIVGGINGVRAGKMFTRTTDILAAPQLTDASPYLPVAWEHVKATGFGDELDIERIPQQLLSLLRVDDHPIYETYIFTEKLRPALRMNHPTAKGSPVAPDGTVLNYEVAGQAVRRVMYELTGAKEWHESLKNEHPGFWRDKEGNLQPLPPLRPKVLHSSTLQLN